MNNHGGTLNAERQYQESQAKAFAWALDRIEGKPEIRQPLVAGKGTGAGFIQVFEARLTALNATQERRQQEEADKLDQSPVSPVLRGLDTLVCRCGCGHPTCSYCGEIAKPLRRIVEINGRRYDYACPNCRPVAKQEVKT